MVDLGESDDLLVADLVLIIVFLGNADGMEEIEILGNLNLLGGNLPKLLVGQGDLYAVVNVEPRNILGDSWHTIQDSH